VSSQAAMRERSGDDKIAVLFVHGVGIREPDYARSAITQLRKEFAGRRRTRRRTGTCSSNRSIGRLPSWNGRTGCWPVPFPN